MGQGQAYQNPFTGNWVNVSCFEGEEYEVEVYKIMNHFTMYVPKLNGEYHGIVIVCSNDNFFKLKLQFYKGTLEVVDLADITNMTYRVLCYYDPDDSKEKGFYDTFKAGKSTNWDTVEVSGHPLLPKFTGLRNGLYLDLSEALSFFAELTDDLNQSES